MSILLIYLFLMGCMCLAPLLEMAMAAIAIHRSTGTLTYRILWLPLALALGYCALEGASQLESLGTRRYGCVGDGGGLSKAAHYLMWSCLFLPIYSSLGYLLWRFPTRGADGAPPTWDRQPLARAAVCLGGFGLVFLVDFLAPLEPWGHAADGRAAYAPPAKYVTTTGLPDPAIEAANRAPPPPQFSRLRLYTPGVTWACLASLVGMAWISLLRNKGFYRFLWPVMCAVALLALWNATHDITYELRRLNAFPGAGSPTGNWMVSDRERWFMLMALGLPTYPLWAWLAWSVPLGASPNATRRWRLAGFTVAAAGVLVIALDANRPLEPSLIEHRARQNRSR